MSEWACVLAMSVETCNDGRDGQTGRADLFNAEKYLCDGNTMTRRRPPVTERPPALGTMGGQSVAAQLYFPLCLKRGQIGAFRTLCKAAAAV